MGHRIADRDEDGVPFQVALSNQQTCQVVEEGKLVRAARAVLEDSAFSSAAISLAIVDDATIHELNRRHLDHDWPTDVLSFVLEVDGGHLEGEVIISAETAAQAAEEIGSTAEREQMLYVIHGMLHLIGYGDKSESERQKMRAAEERYLQRLDGERSTRRATS